MIVTALLIALSYVAVAVITDAHRLTGALLRLGFPGCSAVLALSCMNYLVRFNRWKSFLSRLQRTLPVGRHFLYYLAGFAFTISPAKAGEAVRSLYLRDHGVAYTESFAALFVERLLDLLAIVLLASLIVLGNPAFRPLIIASFLVVIIVIVCVCQPSLPRLIERIGGRGKGIMARLAYSLASLLRSSRSLLHPRPLTFGVIAGLVAWGAEGIGFGIICHSLQIKGSFEEFCAIYAVAVLAGSVAFILPAGIGGTEVVMTALLIERGSPLRDAIVATLLCRLATLWFAVLIGVASASAVELSDQSKITSRSIP
ncbi:MAG: lysylphosphatidylglycerol synthase transmembrane domain-containing protein [Steroidobacteraceae bacterium]